MEKKKNPKNADELNKYKNMAKEIPDIRHEKIDEIKKKIESGRYELDAEAIINKMIELTQDINKMRCNKKDINQKSDK